MSAEKSSKFFDKLLLAVFWLYVSVPLAWGVWSTIKKALALFN